MIGRDKKEEIVSQARTAMSAAQAVFIAENRGMTAAEMATLQRNVRAGGGRAQVMKNTLAKLALKDSPFAALSDSLSGPLVFGIAPDAAAVAKAFSTAAKAHEHFIIRGGILSQGAMLDAGEIGRLANIDTFAEGDVIFNALTGQKGIIHRSGVNYVIAITESGEMFRAWVKDIRAVQVVDTINKERKSSIFNNGKTETSQ